VAESDVKVIVSSFMAAVESTTGAVDSCLGALLQAVNREAISRLLTTIFG
jgi:hypothetical protein